MTTSILAFSGGIDSTYILKYLLTETDDTVIAHHVHMKNHENRWREENIACQNIVEYCKNNFRDFTYSVSTVDRTGMKHIGYDIYTAAAEMGAASHNVKFLIGDYPDHVYFGMHTGEFGRGNSDDKSELYINQVLEANCHATKIPRYKRHPLLSKKESIDYIGEDLYNMTWYCRRPVNGLRCGGCKACLEVANA